MFNNKFNSSKKDPLVEAVQGAMQDGDLRRQAIAYVNEQFGVFSRNAVVNEHKAAYDAALEEAYRSIKEGKPLTPAQDRELDVHDDDKIDAKDFAKLRAMRKGKRMEEKKDCYEEADGLPPSAAAREAGAKQEKETPSSTPAPTRTKDLSSTFSSARGAAKMDEEQLDELKKPTAKTAMDAYYRAYDSDVRDGGEGKRTARLGRWKDKHLPGKSARNQKDTGKAEMDDYDRKVVKKGGTLTKASQKDTKGEIKSRLGKHTKPSLPEEYFYEAIARKRDIAKGGVTAPIEYADKMGFANPGAISKLDEAWNKLKEARKCMEEESDTFDFSHLDEAYANYIAEAINEYGLQEEHPVVTVENLHMFNESYIAAVLDEAAEREYEKAKEHEEKTKELDEARMRAEKECNEEELEEAKKWIQSAIKRPGSLSKKLGVPEEKNIPASKLEVKKGDTAQTKKQKVLAKTLKHLARKKKMEEELQIDEVSAFGQAFRAAGGKNFTFGGKTYSGARADGKNVASKPATATSAADTSGQTKMDAMNKLGQSPAPTPAQNKQAADIVRDKGPSMTRQYSFPGSTVAPPARDVNATTPSKPASAADVSGQDKVSAMNKLSTAPAPAATPEVTKQAADIVRDKGPTFTRQQSMAGINESVQVGDNKYRIV